MFDMPEILTFNQVKIALSVSVFPKRMFCQSEMQSSNIWTISRAHPICNGSKIFLVQIIINKLIDHAKI